MYHLGESFDRLAQDTFDLRIRRNRLATGFFIFSVAAYASESANPSLDTSSSYGLHFSSATPVKHCRAIGLVQSWAASIQIPLNSLLFFFRIRAVFYRQPLIIASFALLWLGIVGTSFLAPFALKTIAVGPTGYCLNDRLEKEGIIGVIMASVYDTLVFVSITTKLLVSYSDETSRWRSFFTGQGMGRLSRVMMQTGQLYYL